MFRVRRTCVPHVHPVSRVRTGSGATLMAQRACHGVYADETTLAYSYVAPPMLQAIARVLGG